jgi:TonB-linked SusC/RagA family outer membrane protein
MNLQKLIRFVCLLLLFIISSMQLYAQGPKITGTVLDQKTGKPLAGVSVKVKNSSQSTITNEAGVFTIKAPSAFSIITFSFVGYGIKEVKAGSAAPLDISLSEVANELDDVVVVGYGTQKRSHLTGSVATVEMKNVTDLPVGNMSEALKGQVNGVSISGGFARPGEVATITIRNPLFYSKDGGSKDPLFIIDDIVRSKTDFDILDASEIENVSVLKDAAAAIYGILGSNGVIVVRTKRGKSGTASINYSGSYGVSDATEMPKMMTGYQQAQYMNDYNGGSKLWDTTATYALPGYYTADELASYKTHNYQWLPMAWQSSHNMRHTLNVSGGSDKATYFAGFNYNENNSNFDGAHYKRYSFRSSSDIKLANGLKLALGLSADLGDKKNTFNKQGNESLDNDWRTLVGAPQFVAPYINGLPILIPGTGTSGNINNYNYFAVHDLDNYTSAYTSVINFQGQLSYEFPFLKGLKASVNYNKNVSNSWGKQYGTKYSVYNFNTLGAHNHILDTSYNKTYSFSNGDRIRLNPILTTNYQLNGMLNYDRSFGKHQIGVLFGYEQSETFSDGVAAMVDGVVVGGLDNQNFATGTQTSNQSTMVSEAGRVAFIGRVDYNYAGKYLVELQFRADASQNFAPENRWGYFPSGSLGWVISEEPFFRNLLSKVNYFKIRASAGFLGLDATKSYQWLRSYQLATGKAAVYGGSNSTDRGNAIITNVEIANRAVHWDNVNKYNIGIDSKFLNNRLAITTDAYIDYRSDMLSNLTSSPSLLIGAALPSENFAKANTFGFEASFNWRDKIDRDWGYNMTANFNWMDDKQIIVDQPTGNIGTYLDATNKSDDVGFLGYHSLGMLRTQSDVDALLAKTPNYTIFGNAPKPGMLYFQDVRGPKDATGNYTAPDGKITLEDQDYLNKHATNHYGLGFNWGVTYKTLSLNVVMGLSWGGVSSVESAARKLGTAYSNRPEFWADHWTPTNTNAKYPSPYYNFSYDLATDFWWRSSTSFRVSNFNLSYALPQQWASKANFNSARIYLIGTNPLNFFNPYNYKDNANGSYDVFPQLRTFTLGLNVNL